MQNVNLLTTAEVADRLNVSEQTLRHWRTQNRGPRYLKLGKAVRYRPADITTWIEEQQ